MTERYVILPASTEVDILNPTLRQSLEGKIITEEQDKAVDILDGMSLSYQQKRNLFFFYMWQQNPSFGPIKQFEDIREDSILDSLLNNVIYDQKLVVQYDRFYYKYHEDDIIRLKKGKMSHKNISQELDIPLSAVNSISKNLVLAGKAIPINPAIAERARAYREFCDRVIVLRNEGVISYEEIAQRLGVNSAKVKQAIRRLVIIGEIIPLKKEELGQMKRDGSAGLRRRIISLRKNTNYTRLGIAKRLGITLHQLDLQINLLLQAGELQTVRDKKRNIAKSRLRKVLREHLRDNPNSQLILRKIKGKDGIPSDFDVLSSLYDEIAEEERVPPRIVKK